MDVHLPQPFHNIVAVLPHFLQELLQLDQLLVLAVQDLQLLLVCLALEEDVTGGKKSPRNRNVVAEALHFGGNNVQCRHKKTQALKGGKGARLKGMRIPCGNQVGIAAISSTFHLCSLGSIQFHFLTKTMGFIRN